MRSASYLQVIAKELLAVLVSSMLASAAIEPPKPGWNLFSTEQDIQLGREARAQVESQKPVVRNREVVAYLERIGGRLAQSRYAGRFPYTFGVIADKNVNAFSLPGGPIYVNTGLFAMAENESQLAGVIAHEMSHIALRHATNQVSKANIVKLPAILLGAFAGGGMMGELTRVGIGLGANSVLLKFSRGAESEADYNAVLMMSDAGYNPLELAHFFEKLEAQSGSQGALSQFLSDHPNPGNRVEAIRNELRELPRRSYTADSGGYTRIQKLVAGSSAARSSPLAAVAAPMPEFRNALNLHEYRGNGFVLSYPANWDVSEDRGGVTLAPREGRLSMPNGSAQVGYGVLANVYRVPGDLRRQTSALITSLSRQNPGLRSRDQRSIRVDGEPGLVTTLNGPSPFAGSTEVEGLVTVATPDGLFYAIFIAPSAAWSDAEPVFAKVIGSIRFH